MSSKRPILNYIVAYLLWIISIGLGILVLNLGREAILLNMVVAASQSDASQSEKFYASLRATAVSTWTILVIGLLLLILIVGIENLYRVGAGSTQLAQRFFLVTGVEFSVLFIIHSIYFALLQTFRPLTWTAGTLLAIELLIAALFFWLFRRERRARTGTRQ